MRGEGSAQKSIGEVGTRQTPARRRSFEERKRKKGRGGGDDDDDDPDGKTAVSTQSLVDGRHRYKCMHTARPVLPFFNALREEEDFSWGGLFVASHHQRTRREGSRSYCPPLFKFFNQPAPHRLCVCVCGSCFAFATPATVHPSFFLSVVNSHFSVGQWTILVHRRDGGSRKGIKTSIPFAPTLCP